MGTSPLPLSVVILAKNEARRISDCLQSVCWAAERLVIDDGSTDETAQLAVSCGARVLTRTMDLEGRHRNWAHAHAAHEWILSLDADERVTPELAQDIRELFAQGPGRDVYAIPRRNYVGDRWVRHGGWYPSPQVKLFKKSIFRWEETTVHPRAISDRPWGVLAHDLLHYSYRDRGDVLAKLDRHTSLEAKKWVLDGRRMSAGKALWRSVDRFVRSYVLKQGYLDGGLGLFLAWVGGAYQWRSYVKYVKLKRQTGMAPATTPGAAGASQP